MLGVAALNTAASAKSCLRFLLLPLAVWLFGTLVPEPAAAQQAVIQRIDIVGNRRVPRDTVRARLFVRYGDPYDEDALRRDFQALWNTQYFEDVRLEVEDSSDRPNAKIVVFYVRERPIIRRIEYCKMPEPNTTLARAPPVLSRMPTSVWSAISSARAKRLDSNTVVASVVSTAAVSPA